MIHSSLSQIYPRLTVMAEEDENTEDFKKARVDIDPKMISDHIV